MSEKKEAAIQAKTLKKAEEKKAEEEEKKAEPEKKTAKKKAEAKTKKKAEEKKEERIMTLSLRDAWASKRTNRTRAAVKVLKRQLKRHVKKEVKIDKSLNELIWARGDQHPPRKVRVRVVIGAETATAYPAK